MIMKFQRNTRIFRGSIFKKQIPIYINLNTAGLKLICGIVIERSAESIIDRVPFDALDYVIGSVE